MDEVRRMTIHDVGIAQGYWKRNPSLRVLVAVCAAALGVDLSKLLEKKAEAKNSYMTEEEFRRLVQMTGGKIEGVGPYGG